jgi:hypothetical protein
VPFSRLPVRWTRTFWGPPTNVKLQNMHLYFVFALFASAEVVRWRMTVYSSSTQRGFGGVAALVP